MRRIPSSVIHRLPSGLAVGIVRWQRRGRYGTTDERVIDGPGDLEVRACWGPPGVVDGPCVSVMLGRDEILRIDLGSAPHVHYKPTELAALGPVLPRVRIDAGDRDARIERAVFEVRHNVSYCVLSDRRRRVRSSEAATNDLSGVADRLRSELHDLYQRHAPDGDAA